jgi:hypothetical protein
MHIVLFRYQRMWHAQFLCLQSNRYVQCSFCHLKAGTWIFFLILRKSNFFLLKFPLDSSEIPHSRNELPLVIQLGFLINGFKSLKTSGLLVHSICRCVISLWLPSHSPVWTVVGVSVQFTVHALVFFSLNGSFDRRTNENVVHQFLSR